MFIWHFWQSLTVWYYSISTALAINWHKIRFGFQEDIIEALDLNEYNHITATYFLLAERRLRAQRHDLARRLRLR